MKSKKHATKFSQVAGRPKLGAKRGISGDINAPDMKTLKKKLRLM